jgi:hypothetical protein
MTFFVVVVSCRDSPARTWARLLAWVLIITSSSSFKLSPLSLILLPSCYYVYNTQCVLCVHLFPISPPCVCSTCAIFLCVSPGCVFILPFLWHQSTNVLAWETQMSGQCGSLIIYSSAHHRGLVFAPLTILEVVVWYTLQLAQHTPGWLSWPLPSIISLISDTTTAPWLSSRLLPSSFVFFISLNSL